MLEDPVADKSRLLRPLYLVRAVKDKDNVVKYLMNFNGVANLGKPISARDTDLITERMIPEIRSEAVIEHEVQLDNNFKVGSDYEKIFPYKNMMLSDLKEILIKIKIGHPFKIC
jgi:hypothetical protein